MNYNKYMDRMSNTCLSYYESKDLPIEKRHFQHRRTLFQDNDSILNNIIKHPFIDTLPTEVDSFTNSNCCITFNKCNIVLYRIQHHNDNHYVEFYLPFDISCNSRVTIGYHNKYSISNDTITNDLFMKYLKEHISDIPGNKRFKGHIVYNNIMYMIVQLRNTISDEYSSLTIEHNNNNNKNNNWLTLWDIIAYKHVFREKLHPTIVDFFVKHHKLAYLVVNSRLCLLPMVLYCHVSKEYKEYVKKNKSIQYCQRENGPIVHLHSNCLCEMNTIRNICFITDNDIVTSRQSLQDKSYVFFKQDNQLQYLFKDDSNIISYIK